MDKKEMGQSDRKWWVLFGTALAGLVIGLDFSIVNIALTSIQKDFPSTINQLQWIMTGFGIGFCAFLGRC